MTQQPFVSIIVPCRNEARYICRCLDSILATTYPADRFEILVPDGQSVDATPAILADYTRRDSRVLVLDNPGRTAPAALNVGIARARGEIVMRMDAHAAFPPDYVAGLVSWLAHSGADNVGAVAITRPADSSAKAGAIALALSHPFGVGNSYFRIGVSEPRWVDTVPFGCYRRDVFDRIGLFDEQLVRNQDDEFNLRLIRRGGRILLVPAITCEYFARDSVTALARMYYQYGYFKPLVARKVGAVLTWRQLVPAVWLSAIAILAVASIQVPQASVLLISLLATYATVDIVCAARAAARRGVGVALWLAAIFPVIHASYGFGFLRGFVDFILRGRRPSPTPAVTAGSASTERV